MLLFQAESSLHQKFSPYSLFLRPVVTDQLFIHGAHQSVFFSPYQPDGLKEDSIIRLTYWSCDATSHFKNMGPPHDEIKKYKYVWSYYTTRSAFNGMFCKVSTT